MPATKSPPSSTAADAQAQPSAWWPWATPRDWPALAPQALSQPINPGWSFGNLVSVTQVNSSAPDVERAVLDRHSYGRQLGRLLDAVAALVDAAPALHDDKRISAFAAIVNDIDAIKQRNALPRLERLRAELAALQRDDPKAYAALRKTLMP